MNLLEDVQRLGDGIYSKIKDHDVVADVLPDVALAALDTSAVVPQLTWQNLADVVATAGALPLQGTGGIGDPPVTLYRSPGDAFYIEALMHSSASMAIHDHNFSGAFAVVSGDCAHQVYDYETDDPSGELTIGELTPTTSEPLFTGACRPIHNGTGLIHRNLHLDRPTVTVVVRTVWDGGRTHIYQESGLALDTHQTPVERKQIQFLAGLLRFDEAAALRYLEQVLATTTRIGHAYRCVDLFVRRTDRWDDLDRLLLLAKHIFGQRTAAVGQALRRVPELDPVVVELLNARRQAATSAPN